MPSTATLASAASFGELLRQLRRRAGLTQGELALQVGFSGAQVSRLEQNERLPDLALIAEKFAPALGLQEEPHLLQRLLELAAAARGERPPTAIRVTRVVQATIQERVVDAPSLLPSAPTLLIGRAHTLRSLSQRLLEAPGRLLTLVGPPGVGKTRLALAVAAQVQDLFADGARLIPLATLSDPDLVAATIVAGLGLATGSTKPPAERLVEHLRRQEILLVLDNFEQVNAAAPLIAQLLEECPGLRVLVTSREPLRLRAEQRFKALPLEPAAAVELFLQRAQAINPDFTPSAKDATLLAELCLRLDCLPLAIELVAARSELFTPGELLDQLQHGRLDLLEAGAPDLPERQRTLRKAIAWSYQLLPSAAQQLFRRMAVFVGGCNLDALKAVLGAWSNQAPASADALLITNLQALIANSLLVQHEVAGGRRYTMLETIGEFALEQATLRQEVEVARRRHAGYFGEWVALQVQLSFHQVEGVWWQRLEEEHENLRAALRWSLQSDGEQALRLASALHPFWDTRGYQNEGSRWLQQALALNPAPTLLRAQGLLKAGIFAQQRMDFQLGSQWLDEALALFAAANDQAGVAETLRAWGWLASNRGDSGRARQCFEESLPIFRALNNQRMVATVLCDLVHILNYAAAPYAQTCAYIEESLTIFRELGEQHGIALALRQQGINETRVGNYALAVSAYADALTIWRRRGSDREIAWTLEMLGEAYWLLGDVAAAASHWAECLPLFQAMDEEFGTMILFQHLGQVERVSGNPERAGDYYVRVLRYFAKLENSYFVARALAGLGGVALARGQMAVAAQLLAAAYRLLGALPSFLAPADQADYARLVERARIALGEDGFPAAWAAGNNLSREQAIRLGERQAPGV